jgi:hypothetical protein
MQQIAFLWGDIPEDADTDKIQTYVVEAVKQALVCITEMETRLLSLESDMKIVKEYTIGSR